jgi:hypothetical protein
MRDFPCQLSPELAAEGFDGTGDGEVVGVGELCEGKVSRRKNRRKRE